MSENPTGEGASWNVVGIRLKPGFGIGNRNQSPTSVSVSQPIFFPETETFFFKIFLMFTHFLGFYKLEKTRPLKII